VVPVKYFQVFFVVAFGKAFDVDHSEAGTDT
jgi:hypothetical protein